MTFPAKLRLFNRWNRSAFDMNFAKDAAVTWVSQDGSESYVFEIESRVTDAILLTGFEAAFENLKDAGAGLFKLSVDGGTLWEGVLPQGFINVKDVPLETVFNAQSADNDHEHEGFFLPNGSKVRMEVSFPKKASPVKITLAMALYTSYTKEQEREAKDLQSKRDRAIRQASKPAPATAPSNEIAALTYLLIRYDSLLGLARYKYQGSEWPADFELDVDKLTKDARRMMKGPT